MKKTRLMLALIALLLTVESAVSSIAEDRPNVVIIMADDLGYECIGANGAEDYETPAIDRLAEDGVRFEQCFANPKCTPSRVKLMTGLYNVRNYTKFGELDRSQTTFAHLFKKAGYATVIAGKWQLGSETDSPRHFGFDQSCLWQHTRPREREGTTIDSRFPNPQIEINGVEVDYNKGEYGPDVTANFICDFIEENKDGPFLAYYPMILTHCPFDATPDSEAWDPSSLGSLTYKGPGGKELQQKHFKDMLQYADKLVGKIVGTLDRLGLRENTIIIFTGDNGTDTPIKTKWNGRLIAGAKGKVKDAGARVPFIVNWPGRISPKVEPHELVEFSDVLPTLSDATGVALPQGYPSDGLSLWPVLTGAGEREKTYVYIWYMGHTWARTVDYGVLLKNEANEFKYQKFDGHYRENVLRLDSATESERVILTRLRGVIDSLKRSETK